MRIDLNPAEGVPLYRQIVSQMRNQAALGLLDPDQPLPSIRILAARLGVAPNTIAKAYEALEAQGVVHRRRGLGTFPARECTQVIDGQCRRVIEQKIDALLAEAYQLNFTPQALLELMHCRQAARGQAGASGCTPS